MTSHALPESIATDADLDGLFAAEGVPAYGHADYHATCGLSANDETTYMDALFTTDAVSAHGHANTHATCGLSANDETVYAPIS
ncbi:hypothetical protein [Actinoallomurus sp. CA-150999]|uniref:hypothetical protein n=1 Tax=Actinoallomurus sp. CA-150999 TaxID=3239887 RepID=UPI003D91F480